ncbi:hypothetical protein D9M71_678670 [compost metagenome]
MTVLQSPGCMSRNTTLIAVPALFTSTSTGPTSRLIRAKASWHEAQSATLPSEAMKSKPRCFCSASQASLCGDAGPQPTTTVKPSRARRWQMAVPRPPIPAVT